MQNRQVGLQSPAKRFSSIRTRCLEATAIILSGLNNVRATRLAITSLESLTEGVVKSDQYVKHHQFFLWCVEEALGMLNVQDKTEVNYFTAIFLSVVQFTDKIGNSPTYQHPDYIENLGQPVGLFFLAIENMLGKIDRTEDGCAVALFILQELKRLPVHVMTSKKSWPLSTRKKYSPVTVILQLMLKKDFIHMAYLLKRSTLKEKYFSVFEKLVFTTASSKEDGLAALDTILRTIKEESSSLLISPSKNICLLYTSPSPRDS